MDVNPSRREEWIGPLARVKWVVFNPKNRKLKLDSRETSEPYIYVGAKAP